MQLGSHAGRSALFITLPYFGILLRVTMFGDLVGNLILLSLLLQGGKPAAGGDGS